MSDDAALYGETLKPTRRSRRRWPPWTFLVLGVLAILTVERHLRSTPVVKLPKNADAIRARCENLKLLPGQPPWFSNRTRSERFAPGTRSVLIKNATIWTGDRGGNEVLKGSILLENGLIKALGSDTNTEQHLEDLVVLDAEGGWVTPGIIDLHSHLGVFSVPKFSSAIDGSSQNGNTQPWLRAIDGLNTHDKSLKPAIAGGVTTALVLPGSEDDIGGQAFPIKLRSAKERSPSSMLLEPPFSLNATDVFDWTLPPRWRHMKHACGENPRLTYGNSRMDNAWDFREIYDRARRIKEMQDVYCAQALEDEWDGLGEFPDDLRYEALVDVLRGRVKIHVHCYEVVDLDAIVRLSNEFKFSVAAFHHAHEAYLVPDLLKKAYGDTPAAALFATSIGFKREAFRGSEFAPRILADNNISVVMKEDPVLNSRYLLYEAQQAHYYGLPENVAMASVTLAPARVMGMDHRIGYIRRSYDADVVLWDSHPLSLGATPRQVFIDGVPQFDQTYSPPTLKPQKLQNVPAIPEHGEQVEETLKHEGLPPLETKSSISGTVVFKNLSSLWIRSADGDIQSVFEGRTDGEQIVIVRNGRIACIGSNNSCSLTHVTHVATELNLKGGAISPGLVSFGSSLGLEEILGEETTKDGFVPDPLDKDVPIPASRLVRAIDGLQFGTRHAYRAYRAGVTVGVTSPANSGFLSGLSTAFRLGASHKLEAGAIIQDVVAVHVTIGHSVESASTSTQIAALRRFLLDAHADSGGKWFKEVVDGEKTLVVKAESADVIATLLHLKSEVEDKTGRKMKMTIAGAAEAHLIASEVANSGVGVILAPSRPFPLNWEQRRFLPGPPITKDNAVSVLVGQNVTVGLGVIYPWDVRNTRFDAAWAALDAQGRINKSQALSLVSANIEKIVGLDTDSELSDLVVTEGSDVLDIESRVIGIISPRKGVVDLL